MLDYFVAAFAGPGAGFMYAITALLAYAVSVAIERAFVLGVASRVDDAGVRQRLEQGDVAGAAELAGSTPMGTVLAAGAAEDDVALAWEAMSAAAIDAEAALRRRVQHLAAVSNLATMLGLLGTVYGLILAFSALGDASAGERAVRLSEGISTAMATTAYGLLVGIPALGLHAWLDGVAGARLARIEAAAGRLALALRRASSDG
ncbi:MAG: MotA/TolQ/ExbB proton channel family protein [Alphaproteobacteria bacterium]|nr:MotA/TolQ/ExbB proton channel family protein [Alphaproteobacteria bacterium]